MTNDEADLAILSLANEKLKFALEIGRPAFEGTEDAYLQLALERGIDGEWFTLVDVSPVAEFPGRLFRIFRLTDAGVARLKQLKAEMP